MAHFLKPSGDKTDRYKSRSDGVLASMTIPTKSSGQKANVVLWGGGKGGEHLTVLGHTYAGKLMATGKEKFLEKHAVDPDGDHFWYWVHEITPLLDDGTGVLTAFDKTGMPFARIACTIKSGKVNEIEQVLKGAEVSVEETRRSVEPHTLEAFRRSPTPKGSRLAVGNVTKAVHEMRFRLEKDGSTFWVGAVVPAAITDFTRAYIFFHPDTMGGHSSSYPEFGARWVKLHNDYVLQIGMQVASKGMVFLMPFMTKESQSANTAPTNMFKTKGLETLQRLMNACQTALGRTPSGTLSRVGVASYSSGVNHLARFAQNVAATGIIKEQVDFDSPYETGQPHSNPQKFSGVRNITVTQMFIDDPRLTACKAAAHEWIQLGPKAWETVGDNGSILGLTGKALGDNIHGKIGNYTLRAILDTTKV
jgi:hypothetical protein